jgi:hypothetical protein
MTNVANLGIEPVPAADTGETTTFYYPDPENNVVELLADNFWDWDKSSEFMRTSSEFCGPAAGKVR